MARSLPRLWLFGATAALASCAVFSKVTEVVTQGENRWLLARPKNGPPNSPSKPGLLILAIDGVGRDLLYSMLRAGELPELGALLGQEGSTFPHAYFADDLLTTVPSTTGVAWATIFTGVPPAQHGFAGNEFFVRETREFAAPLPVSVHAMAEAISVFTDGYADRFLSAPTIYETMRKKDPSIMIWVSMSQFYAGADRLLMTRTSVIAEALEAFLSGHTTKNLPREVWAHLDSEDVEVVVERLKKAPLPDVLTVYLFGTDNWTHVAPEGPDVARTKYLIDVIDPALGTLRKRLIERDALRNRYVVVVSDHGHTAVVHDDQHALSTHDKDDPPAVLAGAGFRVRPFEGKVSASDPFQSVLAYQGAVAYVYVADRSTCADAKSVCDWSRPPRYEEDVLPVADAFYRNNVDGSLAAGMKGALDLVLTRRPVPFGEVDGPFEVYVGEGKTEPIDAYLAAYPHPTYVELESRLRDLAVGPHGERAGDVLLLAHNGDRDRPEDRYYFATPYHSWHGSPSFADSRIPLIVAHPARGTVSLQSMVREYLGENPSGDRIGAMLVRLREGPAPAPNLR